MSPQDESERTIAREERDATQAHLPASKAAAPSRADRDGTMQQPPGTAALLHLPGVPAIPGYLVRAEIARGGMGIVLAAQDTSLNREVAIKTLLPGATGVEWATRRFVEEARITARLQHPGIPPIHQVGTLPDGRPFLAMKLIRGRTLAAILAARQQRPSTQSVDALELTALESPGLLHIFEQICQAVGYAHSQGVIHRDLKPANVMVGHFGEVQVMDWGLARASKGEGKLEVNYFHPAFQLPASAFQTVPGRALGTPQYMPPEQARGEWDQVDARTDVFALGGILTAILTGNPPYIGTHLRVVLRRAEAGDLSECFARLEVCEADQELIDLAKRCLAPDRDGRPADGAEVARQIAVYRLGVEARLVAAEHERTIAFAKAEEARLRAAAEAMAKRAAEERAEEADLYAKVVAAQAREQQRRRGVFVGTLAVLALLAGMYGGYRKLRVQMEMPAPTQPAPFDGPHEAAEHLAEHEWEVP